MKHKVVIALLFLPICIGGCSKKVEEQPVDTVAEVTEEKETEEADENVSNASWKLENFKGLGAKDSPYTADDTFSYIGKSCTELDSAYDFNLANYTPETNFNATNNDGLSILLSTYTKDFTWPFTKDSWDDVYISGIKATWHNVPLVEEYNEELTKEWQGKTIEDFDNNFTIDEEHKIVKAMYEQNQYAAYVMFSSEKEYINEWDLPSYEFDGQILVHFKPVVAGDCTMYSSFSNNFADNYNTYFKDGVIDFVTTIPYDYSEVGQLYSIPDLAYLVGMTLDEMQEQHPEFGYSDLVTPDHVTMYPNKEAENPMPVDVYYDEDKVITKVVTE